MRRLAMPCDLMIIGHVTYTGTKKMTSLSNSLHGGKTWSIEEFNSLVF